MRKKKRIFLFLVAAMLLLSACGFGGSGGSSGGDKVVNLSLRNDIPDLNQVLTTDGISFTVLNNVMEGLYRLDEKHEPQPAMAKSVDISDDKLTYTFHLRDDIKWSNGDPVTAEDFRYSWLRATHPETSGAYANIIYDYVAGAEDYFNGGSADDVAIKALDDKTLEVKLNTPTPYFLSLTAFVTYFPLNEKFINEVGDDKFALTHDAILYNGPYVLTQYDQAQGVTLEKNDQYWDKNNVDVDKVTMKVIKEDSTALNLYEAGDLDRVYLSASDVNTYKDSEEFGTETEFISWYIQFNMNKAPFDNANIRKAFQLSYDPQILVDTVLNNGSEASRGLVAKGVYGNGDKTFRELNGNVVEQDNAKAKEYLEKGIAEIGSTLPKVEILTADDTIAKDTATFLQSQFKQNLGVDIQIVTKPYSGRLDAMRADDYQFAITRWGSDYNDANDILSLWRGEPATPMRGHYFNKDFNKLIDAAVVEADADKRLQMLMEAEKILVGDANVGPLYYEGKAYLQKPHIKDYVNHPYGAPLELKMLKVEK